VKIAAGCGTGVFYSSTVFLLVGEMDLPNIYSRTSCKRTTLFYEAEYNGDPYP